MSIQPGPAAVLFVSDVARLTRFYASLANMTVLHEEEGYAVLELMGFQLTIHAMRGGPEAPASGAIVPREDSYMKLCFPVASIAAARVVAAAHGGAVQSPEREWVAEDRGFRACDGHDPEGNILQLRERVD